MALSVALASAASAVFLPISAPIKVALAIAFLLLPLFVTVPRGVPLEERTGTRIVVKEAGWQRVDRITRFVAALFWLGAAPALFGYRLQWDFEMQSFLALWIAFALSVVSLTGLFRRATAKPENLPSVLIEDESFTIFDQTSEVIRFAELVRVEHDGTSVTAVTKRGSSFVIVDPGHDMARRVHEAIESAWERWKRQGRGQRPIESLLSRPTGASAREWLGTLDTMAAAREGAGAYRGVGVDEEELWATLNDDRAKADARAAAARLLARDDERRVRVAERVRVVEDAETRARIEATLKPAEEAAAELEAMEAEQMEREAGR